MATRLGYRELKKLLNRYHKFSFKTPRKGKDFTPQQKAAITRQFQKLQPLINADRRDTMTFIKYPQGSKLPGIDAVRTNQGLFFPLGNAKLLKSGRSFGHQQYRVAITTTDFKELYFPFPYDVQQNPEWIKIFVDDLIKKFKPYAIKWATAIPITDKKGRQKVMNQQRSRYDPDSLFKYITATSDDDEEDLEDRPDLDDVKLFYVGVYLIFEKKNTK